MSLPKSLRFDKSEQAWIGTIPLPMFERCQVQWDVDSHGIRPTSRRPAGKSRRGRFTLLIEDPSKQGPTAPQRAAVEYLQSHEQSMFAAAIRMAFRECRSVYYPESLPVLRGLNGEMRERRALFNTSEGFQQLVGLTAVTVLREEKRGVAYISFDFSTALDHEHGISLLFHKTEGIGFAGAGECGGGVPPERTATEQADVDQLCPRCEEYLDSLKRVVDAATARKAVASIQTAKQQRDAAFAASQKALVTDRKLFKRYTQIALRCHAELQRICRDVPEAVEILDPVFKRDEAWKHNQKIAKTKRK